MLLKVTTVVVGILINEGEILLESCADQKWKLPGGRIKTNDTPERALRRELKEAFAIRFKVGKYFGEGIYKDGSEIYRVMGYYIKKINEDFNYKELPLLNIRDLAKEDIMPLYSPIVNQLMDRNTVGSVHSTR